MTENKKNMTFAELNVYRAKEYIHLNYSRKLYLKEVADHVCYSTHYFSKLFKKIENTNFSDYLNNLRIKKAKEYSRHSNLSFREISKKVGYDDFSYFTLVFKKYEGTLPREYRMNKKEHRIL